ncbi:MAG: amidase family protein [Ornithinimicrobium sp.]
MGDFDLATAAAVPTAHAIRDRDVSATEATQAAIARIERLNPQLNAFVYTAFDEALQCAATADAAVASGAELGPLHGVPTAIKDLFDFKPGWPATMGGIPALENYVVPARCMWAERMEEAGAVILGKTNSPVMGFRGTTDNPLFGPTSNPFDTIRNSGGSSGGSAAAVASGMIPFAEGTDGGGSVRIPAAWCGVLGFKQSWGRVPMVMRPNAFAATNPFVFEGVLSRTAADLGTMLSVLSGPHPGDPYVREDRFTDVNAHRRGVSGMRIAYSRDFGGFPVDPGVAAVVDEAVRAFEEAGAQVEEVDTRLPRDQFALGELWCRLIAPLNLATLDGLAAQGIDLLGTLRDQLPAPFLRFVDEAAQTSVRDYGQLQVARTEVYDFVQSFFTGHDLLVTPTLACPPVLNSDNGQTIGPGEVNGVAVDPSIGWCLTYPLNFTGHPAASVPAGMADGLPVGMQVVGRLGADADVIAACGAVEEVRPWEWLYKELAVH